MDTSHPFANPEPGFVPLTKSPLAKVIAQIRFPASTRLTADGDTVAAAIARTLGDTYPIMDIAHEQTLTWSAEGVVPAATPARIWKLTSADRQWVASFGSVFVAIETTAYERRSDFVTRLIAAWDTVRASAKVAYVERVGVRHINQVSSLEHLTDLPRLLRSEVLGVLNTRNMSGAPATVSALSEAQWRFPNGDGLQGRWGLLAANQILDGAIPAIPSESWILDLDSFRVCAPNTELGEELETAASELSLRNYQFFRWAVTEEFMTAHGAAEPVPA